MYTLIAFVVYLLLSLIFGACVWFTEFIGPTRRLRWYDPIWMGLAWPWALVLVLRGWPAK